MVHQLTARNPCRVPVLLASLFTFQKYVVLVAVSLPDDGSKHAALIRHGSNVATISTDAKVMTGESGWTNSAPPLMDEPLLNRGELVTRPINPALSSSLEVSHANAPSVEYSEDYKVSAAVVHGETTPMVDGMMSCEQAVNVSTGAFVTCPAEAINTSSPLQELGVGQRSDKIGNGNFTLWVVYRLRVLNGTQAALRFDSGHLIGLDAKDNRSGSNNTDGMYKYFLGGGSWGPTHIQGLAHPAGEWHSLKAVRVNGQLSIVVDGSMPFMSVRLPENVTSVHLEPSTNVMQVRDFFLTPGAFMEPWKIKNGYAASLRKKEEDKSSAQNCFHMACLPFVSLLMLLFAC